MKAVFGLGGYGFRGSSVALEGLLSRSFRWLVLVGILAHQLLAASAQEPPPADDPEEPSPPLEAAREEHLERRIQELEQANRRLLEQVEALARQYETLAEKLEPPRVDPAVEPSVQELGDDPLGLIRSSPFVEPDPVAPEPLPDDPLPPALVDGLLTDPLPDLPPLEPIEPLWPPTPPSSGRSVADLFGGYPELMTPTAPESSPGLKPVIMGAIPIPIHRLFPFLASQPPPGDWRRFRDDPPEIFPRLERDPTLPFGMPRVSMFGMAFPAVPPEIGYRRGVDEDVRQDLPELFPQIDQDAVSPPYLVGYDNGFFIRPVDPAKSPYELRLGGRLQFRHTAFVPTQPIWVDSAGIVRPIASRNDFEIERGRLTFAGYILDPNMQFYLNIDGGTDLEHRTFFLDFWANYRFSRALNVFAGKAYVPGSREYLDGSARMQFVDRSMATTFFRPGRSVGVWALGEPLPGVYFRTMIANAFRAPDLTFQELDRELVFSGSTWWDVFDNYGVGVPDLEWHEDPAFRVGNSFSYASQGRLNTILPSREVDFVRLTDGTPLTQTGALAPGVTVDEFQIYLYAMDFAAKYRGFSFSTEYYLRWLENIRADGPIPEDSLFATGFYASLGYFVIPQRLELAARTSQVFGQFGNAAEYTGGGTWYIRGSHTWKLTFDATRVIRSPISNFNTNYRAGDTGVMFRTQLQVAF